MIILRATRHWTIQTDIDFYIKPYLKFHDLISEITSGFVIILLLSFPRRRESRRSLANSMEDKRMKSNDEPIIDPCFRRGDIIGIHNAKDRTVMNEIIKQIYL